MQQWWHKLLYDTILYVCTVCYRAVWSVAVSWHKLVYDTILYFMFVLCVTDLYGRLLFLGKSWSMIRYYTLCLYCVLQICVVCCCFSALIHSGYSSGGTSCSMILYCMYVQCVSELYGLLLFLGTSWSMIRYYTLCLYCV